MKSILFVGIKSSMIYMIASLLSKGLAIITMPIFTRLMPSSEIGIVNLYNSWYSMISVVASLSLTSGGFQLAMKEFKNERDQYISSVFCLTFFIAIGIGLIYLFNSQVWNNITGLSTSLMILMIVQLLFAPAYDFWIMRQRYEYKYLAVGIVSISSAILAAGVSLWAVISASKVGLKSLGTIRLVSNYAVQLSIAFIIGIYLFIKGKTCFSLKYWKFSLALSIPLIGNAFASQILNVSDRVMIGKMVGTSAVGVYSTLYSISSLSLLVWNSINASFVPFLFDNIDNRDNRDRIKKVANFLLILFAGIAFSMTIIAPEIVKILATDEYYQAIYIMPPIAAGVFLTSIANMYSNVLIYHKKTQYVMISTCIAASVNVLLNYIGILKYGYMAAAYTTLIAYIIHALIQGCIATKIHSSIVQDKKDKIYDTKIIFVLSFITILLCLCCVMLYKNTIVRFSIIGILIGCGIIFRKKIYLVVIKGI